MSRVAQAWGTSLLRLSQGPRRFATLTSVAGLALLCGCAAGGFSLEKAEVDQSLITGTVPANTQASADFERTSDEATIRNAVSSVDIETLGSTPVQWANAATGSRGAINNLIEHRQNGSLCRKFTASRESFDGVGLYNGEICMAGPGAWRMLAFQPAA